MAYVVHVQYNVPTITKLHIYYVDELQLPYFIHQFFQTNIFIT
ncbi:unnamed protein product, partial [Heterotrigona itama]